MTIAIDATRAVIEKAGIGRHSRELIKHMLKNDQKNQYILIFTYFRKDKQKEEQIREFKQKNVVIRTAKIPGSLKETLWRNNAPFYNNLYKGADILLATSFLEYKQGLKIPQVTIIYDMSTFLFPEQRGEEVSDRLNKQTTIALKGSRKVIAISKSTKKDLEKITSIASNKIEVIYPGLNVFSKISSALPITFNLKPKNYLLFVSTIEPRKNLKNLLIAYNMLPVATQDKYPLVMVGGKGWNTDEELKTIGNSKGIKWLGYVKDADLAKLYKEATLFVYPSLYEGFGFPISEAMQFGTPVITSNISSMPEVAAAAGILIDPNNPKSISSAIQSIIEGKISRAVLKKTGIQQANTFSWDKTAKETIKLLEEVNNV